MQKNNLFESYDNNDEHIYDSICDVKQKNHQTNSTNNTYRVFCTSFVMNDIHEQKSAILSSDPIEDGWQKYWDWCSDNFSHFNLFYVKTKHTFLFHSFVFISQ